MSVVVSDTSPIRALHHLELMWLLERLYGRVFIPPAVAQELSQPESALPPIDTSAIAGLIVRAPADNNRVEQLLRVLDRGESEAMVLAMEIRADVLLIDERSGRAIASSLGLLPVGVLAVLLRAKERGFVDLVKPLMDVLRDGIDFRISPTLYEQISRLAGE